MLFASFLILLEIVVHSCHSTTQHSGVIVDEPNKEPVSCCFFVMFHFLVVAIMTTIRSRNHTLLFSIATVRYLGLQKHSFSPVICSLRIDFGRKLGFCPSLFQIKEFNPLFLLTCWSNNLNIKTWELPSCQAHYYSGQVWQFWASFWWVHLCSIHV